MIKKVIHSTDFNNSPRVDECLFHLTQTEIAKLELSFQGGLVKTVESYLQDKDGAKIIDLFERIIRLAYGVRSVDGREFLKTDDLFEKFYYSSAYDALFMELMNSADAASAFINGIMPTMDAQSK